MGINKHGNTRQTGETQRMKHREERGNSDETDQVKPWSTEVPKTVLEVYLTAGGDWGLLQGQRHPRDWPKYTLQSPRKATANSKITDQKSMIEFLYFGGVFYKQYISQLSLRMFKWFNTVIQYNCIEKDLWYTDVHSFTNQIHLCVWHVSKEPRSRNTADFKWITTSTSLLRPPEITD